MAALYCSIDIPIFTMTTLQTIYGFSPVCAGARLYMVSRLCVQEPDYIWFLACVLETESVEFILFPLVTACWRMPDARS